MEKIAIVGAEKNYWNEKQESLIKRIISRILIKDSILISGGCPRGGVDIWAEQIADKNGIEKIIHEPKINIWEEFKSRNKKIAEDCDILFDIEPDGREHSGGMWTLNFAKRLGKEVVKIVII